MAVVSPPEMSMLFGVSPSCEVRLYWYYLVASFIIDLAGIFLSEIEKTCEYIWVSLMVTNPKAYKIL